MSNLSAAPLHDSPAPVPTRAPIRRAITDLAIVFGVSLVAFFGERGLNQLGWIAVPDTATGASAVIAGFIAAVVLILINRQSLAEMGFRRPGRWWTVVPWTIGILGVYLGAQILLPQVIGLFAELPPADLSRYDSLHQNLPAALGMALLLPLMAALPEELIYRGFLMDRLSRIFGDGRWSSFLVVVIQAMIFGAVHFQWGVGGIIMTFVMGLIWGTAFLLCGRNLWIVIIAHSAGHVLMAIQFYFVKASAV